MNIEAEILKKTILLRIGLILLGAVLGGFTGAAQWPFGYFRTALFFLFTLDMLAALEQLRIRNIGLYALGGIIAGALTTAVILLFNIHISLPTLDSNTHDFNSVPLFFGIYGLYGFAILTAYRICRHQRWQFLAVLIPFWAINACVYSLGMGFHIIVLAFTFVSSFGFTIVWYAVAWYISGAERRVELKVLRRQVAAGNAGL